MDAPARPWWRQPAALLRSLVPLPLWYRLFPRRVPDGAATDPSALYYVDFL